MELLNLPVALELSKAIAKSGTMENGVYTLVTDGFEFIYILDARNGPSVEVIYNNDPFICDWVGPSGESKPCRFHLTRYNFPRKILEIAIKQGIIRYNNG